MAQKEKAVIELELAVRAEVNQAKKTLEELKNFTKKDLLKIRPELDPKQAYDELQKLKSSVRDIEQAMDKAFDKDLGVLDLSKFQSSLKDIDKIQKSFGNLGATGQRAMLDVAKTAFTTNMELKKTQGILDKLGETMGNTIRWGITSSIMSAFTDSVQEAYGYVKNLDSSLTDIRIVTGKSAEEMAKFAIQANKAAKDLRSTTKAYTDASLIYYQQGLGDTESQTRADITIKAANVTGQSTAETSENLTAIWNGYKVSAAEAELYIDKVAAVAASTAADLEELSTGMSKVASAANVMGVGVDELNAYLATVVSVTRQAPESVGTAFKTIFARISDIEAGIDTETTLGGYTSEMAELGFNVLDANNKLRDQDEVITEIGNKWTTLTREQQVALAQTMAGTRQYNNLLALFDNWGMYNDALLTSQNALGTLNEQQEIYADSVEASLKALNASKEGVYDSLLDPDTVKTVANIFADILSFVEKIVDGLGGGLGVLTAIAGVATKLFSKQLTQGLISPIVKNVQDKKTNEAKLDLIKQNIQGEAKARGIEEGGAGYEALLESQDYFISHRSAITEEGFNRAQGLAIADAEAQQKLSEQEDIKSNYTNFTQGFFKSDAGTDFIKEQKKQNKSKDFNTEDISLYFGNEDFNTAVYESFEQREAVIEKAAQEYLAKLEEIKKQIAEKEKQRAKIYRQKSHAKTDEEKKDLEAQNQQINDDLKNLRKEKKETENNLKFKAEDEKKKLEQDRKDFENYDPDKYRATQGEAENAQALLALEKQKVLTEDLEQSYVELGGAIGEVVAGIATLVNLGDIWNNDDLSIWEKLVQTGIAFVGVFNGLKNAQSGWNTLKKIKNLLEEKGLLLSAANTVATGAEAAATQLDAEATENNTRQEIINQAVKNWKLALLAALAMAIVGVVAAVIKENQALEENAERARETAEATKQFYNETKQAQDELLANLDRYKDIQDSFKNLTAGTQEWKNALQESNQIVLDLIKNNKDLEQGTDYTISSFGQYQLTDAGQEKLKNEADRKTNAAYRDSLIAEVNAYEADALLDMRQIGFRTRNIAGQNEISKVFTKSNGDVLAKISLEDTLDELERLENLDIDITDFESVKEYLTVDAQGNTLTGEALKVTQDFWEEKWEDVLEIKEKLDMADQLAVDAIAQGLKAENPAMSDEEARARAVIQVNTEKDLETKKSEFANKWKPGQVSAIRKLGEESESTNENFDRAKNFLDGKNDINDAKLVLDAVLGEGNYDADLIADTEGNTFKLDGKTYDYSDYYSQVYSYLLEQDAIAKAGASSLDDILGSSAKNSGQAAKDAVTKLIANGGNFEELSTQEIAALQRIRESEEGLGGLLTESGWAAAGLSKDDFESVDLEGLQELYKKAYQRERITAASSFSEALSIAMNDPDLVDNGLKVLSERFDKKFLEELGLTQEAYDEAANQALAGNDERLKNIMEAADELSREARAQAKKEELETTLKIKSLDDLKQAYTAGKIAKEEFYLVRDAFIDEELNNLGKTREELDEYIKLIKEITGEELSEDVVLRIYEQDKGVDELRGSWLDDRDILYNTPIEDQDNTYYIETLNRTKNSLEQILGFEPTKEFIENHKDLIDALVDGEEDALNRMRSVAAESLIKDAHSDVQITAEEIQEILDGLEIGDSLPEEFHSILRQMFEDSETWTLEMLELLESLGFAFEGIERLQALLFDRQNYGTGYVLAQLSKYGLAWANAGDEYLNHYDPNFDEDAYLDKLIAETFDFTNGIAFTNDEAGTEVDKNLSGKQKELDLLDDEIDRYHDINIILAQIETRLGRLQKEQEKLAGEDVIANLNKQLSILQQQVKAYEKKKEIAIDEAKELNQELSGFGVTFFDDGTISNYAEIMQKQEDIVNAAISYYNTLGETGQQDYQDTLDTLQENYQDFKEKISRYDQLISEEIPGLADSITDSLYEQIDLKMQKFNMAIELRLEMSQAERDWNKFKKDIIDDLDEDDILGNATAMLKDFFTYYQSNGAGEVAQITSQIDKVLKEIRVMDAGGLSSIYSATDSQGNTVNDRASALEDLQKYYDEIVSSLNEVKQLTDDINQSYIDMIDQVDDKFQEQIDAFSFVSDLIEHDMKLIELLNGEEAYAEMASYYDRQAANNNSQLDFQKRQIQVWRQEMDNALARGNEEAFAAAQEKWKSAVEDWNSTVESSIENINDKYLNSINLIFQELNNKISGGLGLEYMKQEWELINMNAETYLDDINEAFEIHKLEQKYLDSIENANSTSIQNKLNKLLKEEMDYLEEKDKLTQYDIERANLRYEIALKQIALEEAQANKSQMRLRRDSQGNYSYEFVEDADAIGKMKEELNSLENQLYNLDKEAYIKNLEEMLGIWTDFQEKMAEAAQINDPVIRAETEALVREQYGKKINDIETENIAIRNNLNQSAFNELAKMQDKSVEDFLAMSQAEKDELMNGLVPQWQSGVQNMADAFGEAGFLGVCQESFDKLSQITQQYQEDLDALAEAANVDFEAIIKGQDTLIEQGQEMIKNNEALVESYQAELTAIGNVIDELAKLEAAYRGQAEAAELAAEAGYKALQASKEEQANAAGKLGNNSSGTTFNTDSGHVVVNPSSNTPTKNPGGALGNDGIPNSIPESPIDNNYKLKIETNKLTPMTFKDRVKALSLVGDVKYGGGQTLIKVSIGGHTTESSYLPVSIIKSKYSAKDGYWSVDPELAKILGYDTGGYTGSWGSSGRLALLHQKELVLNADDTKNMLSAVEILRSITDSVGTQFLMRAAELSSRGSAAAPGKDVNREIKQNVYIEANFPHATERRDIEDAINNLVNVASQRAFNTQK